MEEEKTFTIHRKQMPPLSHKTVYNVARYDFILRSCNMYNNFLFLFFCFSPHNSMHHILHTTKNRIMQNYFYIRSEEGSKNSPFLEKKQNYVKDKVLPPNKNYREKHLLIVLLRGKFVHHRTVPQQLGQGAQFPPSILRCA